MRAGGAYADFEQVEYADGHAEVLDMRFNGDRNARNSLGIIMGKVTSMHKRNVLSDPLVELYP
ncbi:hypothetical protein GCM10009425_07450 [Pseudomonas asuensis]|jgi:hypothetical protein|uniref:Uncharacterized protein n=1 Tax=Pseudomonas asuensis TaxID=1825787 RepID=A0ABQ2GJ00_9PSED|nr:hypothetical protein GCM10009425_07450 [Pseudomonas asuensis]